MEFFWRGIIIGIFGLALGCANSPVKSRSLGKDVVEEIPPKLRERFEIKELGSVSLKREEKVTGPKWVSTGGTKKTTKKGGTRKVSATAETAAHESGAPDAASTLPAEQIQSESETPHALTLRTETFAPGEKLIYNIKYLGLVVGEVELQVLPFKVIDGRQVYHLYGHASSGPVFSLVYRLNDSVESFMDVEGHFSHRFHLVLDEKKQQRDSVELYDSRKKEGFYWSRWEYPDQSKKEVKETYTIPQAVQDTLSSLFYLRTLPLKEAAVIHFPLVTEGKTSEVICTVVRRESISSPLGRVQAIVVKPEVKFEGMLKKTGDSFIWYSDDERRIPLRMEARVKIGAVSAELIRVESGASRANASVQH